MVTQAPAPPPAKKPPPPKNGGPNGKPATTPATNRTFSVSTGVSAAAERIIIYGVGGVGKTTLASLAPNPLFIDLEGGSRHLDVARVDNVESWQDLRDVLHSADLWKPYESVVIDSGTSAQDLAIAHTLQTVPHEKGNYVSSIEGYGFGKGYQHVYETFLKLLGDLDQHIRQGRNVILICHERTETAPNPEGDDYLRFEPDLQQPPKNGRLRDRVKNWTDHLLFINYDKVVTDGKAKGHGTRTIYPCEMPTFWAKSRTLRDPIPFHEGDSSLWDSLITKGNQQ